MANPKNNPNDMAAAIVYKMFLNEIKAKIEEVFKTVAKLCDEANHFSMSEAPHMPRHAVVTQAEQIASRLEELRKQIQKLLELIN